MDYPRKKSVVLLKEISQIYKPHLYKGKGKQIFKFWGVGGKAGDEKSFHMRESTFFKQFS